MKQFASLLGFERNRLLTRTDLVTRDSESFISKTRLPKGTVCNSAHLNAISREREAASRCSELTQLLAGKAENEKTPSALALGVFW
jgi:hypothetical protein